MGHWHAESCICGMPFALTTCFSLNFSMAGSYCLQHSTPHSSWRGKVTSFESDSESQMLQERVGNSIKHGSLIISPSRKTHAPSFHGATKLTSLGKKHIELVGHRIKKVIELVGSFWSVSGHPNRPPISHQFLYHRRTHDPHLLRTVHAHRQHHHPVLVAASHQ